jgi:hypothetical protein
MAFKIPAKGETTQLGARIIDLAFYWLKKGCVEVGKNGGDCINEMKRIYDAIDPNRGALLRQPYCSQFTTVITHTAMADFGIQSPIITPGAADFISQCRKNGIRVDNNPTPGCVGYIPTEGGTGHVFIVVNHDKKYVYDIDGNSVGHVWQGMNTYSEEKHEGIIIKRRPITSAMKFAHIEEFGGFTDLVTIKLPSGDGIVTQIASGKGLAIAGGMIALGTFLYNKYSG